LIVIIIFCKGAFHRFHGMWSIVNTMTHEDEIRPWWRCNAKDPFCCCEVCEDKHTFIESAFPGDAQAFQTTPGPSLHEE
jgi:hypothetical protein